MLRAGDLLRRRPAGRRPTTCSTYRDAGPHSGPPVRDRVEAARTVL